MYFVQFLTDYADQAVVLPLAIWIGVGLLILGWARGALVWTLSIGAVLGVMLVLKLLFAACGHLMPFPSIHSPSGHTASAEAVYGGLLALFLNRTRGSGAAIVGAFGFAVVTGITRVLLGAHSIPEVIVGSAIGLAGIVGLSAFLGTPPKALRWRLLAGIGLIPVLALHGVHLGAESVIDWFALSYYWPLSYCAGGVPQ